MSKDCYVKTKSNLQMMKLRGMITDELEERGWHQNYDHLSNKVVNIQSAIWFYIFHQFLHYVNVGYFISFVIVP